MSVSAPTREDLTLAEGLLDQVSALRRATRACDGRPPVFSTLSPSQLELLRLVRRSPGISVTEAARLLAVAPNTVSTLVRALSLRRVLVRAVDAADRRVARLDLTPEMRRSATAWRDRRAALVAGAIARLDPAQRAPLGAALPALAAVAQGLEPRDVAE